MKRGDIYLVTLDPTIGHEQRGTRPVLLISPTKFNVFTQTPIVLPITRGGSFARNAGFAVSLEDTKLTTTGIIRCDQPRALDLPQREGRYLEAVPDATLQEVLARVQPLFA